MIATLHRCSFIDFPGRVSAVVFTRGCNLRCRYCHNPELCLPGGAPDCDLQSVTDFLDTRRGKLAGVVVSGGEPTLHDALLPMLAAIRARGFAVKLDTNGMLPQVVKHIVDCGLIDYIAVDVKKEPGVSSIWLCGADNQGATALESLQYAAKRGVPHEARTTVVRREHDIGGLLRMAHVLRDNGIRAWRLQVVETGRVLDPTADLSPPDESVISSVVDSAKDLGLDALVRRRPVKPNR
ncbi:MAG: anaerobic ribonucleoside-triphosphate reductase activating protein [Desulfobacteraceae bacterium]|nr:anaerobic ribonucleoside-triphosphate reductase activating protein [Desulfobacteraceae bacterium]